MSSVLLIEPSPICRELLAKTLESQGLSVICARDSAEASRALAATEPQLVILDPAADVNSIRFLQSLRRSQKLKDVPVIALTDLCDKSSVVRVAELGVRDYILKSRFSLAELLTRIQKYLRPDSPPARRPAPAVEPKSAAPSTASLPAAPGRPTPVSAPPSEVPSPRPALVTPKLRLTREQTLAQIEAGTQIKTLPGIVAEVISLVNSPRGAISDVAQAVKRDPVLSARVLQVANSAAFVSQKPRVTSIDEAVRNIGVGGVRNMVLAVGIFESFATEESELSDLLRLWQHLFAVAAVMERLVQPSDATPPGSAHLVGLCHDLTELALRQQFPSEYAAAAELAFQAGRPLTQVTAEVFAIPFYELATVLLGKFGLPPLITVPIEEFFERSVRKQPVGLGTVLGRALRLANVYAHGLMLAPSLNEPVTPISNAEYRGAFGDAPPTLFDDQSLWSEAVMAVNVLSGASSALASRLSKPLITPTGLRIWYTRHSSYCEFFDPLASLLRFAGELDVHQGLPTSPGELDGFDVLVAAGSRSENLTPARQDIQTILNATAARPVPVLYLSGVEQSALGALPGATCYRLPVSLGVMSEFFAKARAQHAEPKHAEATPVGSL